MGKEPNLDKLLHPRPHQLQRLVIRVEEDGALGNVAMRNLSDHQSIDGEQQVLGQSPELIVIPCFGELEIVQERVNEIDSRARIEAALGNALFVEIIAQKVPVF